MKPRRIENKILSLSQATQLTQNLRQEKKKVVSTNGCFDLIHLGHIRYLVEARDLGDFLIVGLNSDASVKKLKGAARPIFPEKTRAHQLAALECVDAVVIFNEDTPEFFLEKIRPDLHVKGGDYSPEQLPEKAVVEKGGGKVKILSLTPGHSSSGLLAKIEGL